MMAATASIWAAIANIWFVAWAIRRKGELDYDLDSTAKFVRWVVASFCLGISILRPEVLKSPNLRIAVGFVGLGFLIWPNLAYHLTSLLRFLKFLPKLSAEDPINSSQRPSP